MKPMLAHVWEPHRVTYPCYVQPKFNGVRAVCGTDAEGHRRFQSRDENPWDYEVLRHISESLDFLPRDLVLDGELYVHGWPLQRIAGACAVARSAPSVDTPALQYFIFDTVDYGRPFVERLGRIPVVALASDPYRVAETVRCDNESQVNAYYTKCVAAGNEGIMYRLGDCPYTVAKQNVYLAPDHTWKSGPTKFLSDKNNRTWYLLKRKAWLDGEFEILYLDEGIGKRAGMVGAFVCDAGIGTGAKHFRVGSGLTDAEAVSFWNRPSDVIGRKIKVKYQTLTEDGVPFHPTFEQLL